MKNNILLIAGTRPNFIKLAPLYHTLKDNDCINISICHTGQHFDKNMSGDFFELLELPNPDFQLNAKGGSVAEIIGVTMLKLAPVLQNNNFDLIIVVGDVNATVAGAIAGAQSHIKIMHVEAGLRSGDRSMPEEINRIITDHVSDYLMVSEPSGLENLKNEGIPDKKIHFVGNIMIECLLRFRDKWENIPLPDFIDGRLNHQPYCVCTFHRPENVDDKKPLEKTLMIIKTVAEQNVVVFPMHPRTKNNLKKFQLFDEIKSIQNVLLTPPLSYFVFLKLVSGAKLVCTDSGGIQEETTFLGVPCLTFRKNTERPITITSGTNKLVNMNEIRIQDELAEILKNTIKKEGNTIPKWDDKVSSRVCELIHKKFLSDIT